MKAEGSAPSSTLTTSVSWGVFALVALTLYFSTQVAQTPRGTEARENLQHLHMTLGLSAFVLSAVRLYLWRRTPPAPRPERLPASSFAFARQTCLLLYVTILFFGVTGAIFAWSEGHDVVFLGMHLPSLLEPSYANSVRFGYFHSMLGFWILYLIALAVLIAIWQTLRYRVPIWRMLPGRG